MQLSNDSLRREIKFKIFDKDFNVFLSWLYAEGPLFKAYNDRLVNSIYYDTHDYDFAMSNMSGESERMKIRLRWYLGAEDEPSNLALPLGEKMTFEIKRKKNNLSDKLLFPVRTENLSSIDEVTHLVNIKLEEIICRYDFLSNYNMQMSVFISYLRSYFESYDGTLRVTIDQDLRYASPVENTYGLLSSNFRIVEFKFRNEESERIAMLLKSFPFRPVRFSKYLGAITKIKNVSY